MKFKRKKYYFLIGLLTFIMVLSLTFSSTSTIQNITPDPDIPSIEEPDVTAPVFKDPFKLIEYSVNIYKNGKGIAGVMTTDVITPIASQRMYNTFQRDGGLNDMCKNLQITYKEGNNSFLPTCTSVLFVDEDGMSYCAQTNDFVYAESYNIDGCEILERDYTEVMEKDKRENTDFTLDINKNTAKNDYFYKENGTYYLKFTIKPETVNNEVQYGPLIVDPLIKSVTCTEMSITLEISVKTGYIKKYVIEEKADIVLDGVLSYIGGVECSGVEKVFISSMDKQQTIINPFN